MQYDFDKVYSRVGTNSLKWEFMGNMSPDADEETIPMWIADMDFPSPQPMINAMHDRVNDGIFGYSNINTKEYWSSIANRYRRIFDWYINCEKMVYAPGIVPAFKNFLILYTKPGDGIIIQDPIYYPFAKTTRVTKRTVVNNTLLEKDGYYTMDYEDLERKASDPNNKVIVLCNPHNPTGRVWTEEELRRFYDICDRHDLLIVADEIHQDIIRKGQVHIPLAKLYPDSKRIITCISPSKTFNIAGLKVASVLIPDDDMRKTWNDNATTLPISPVSIDASIAVYNQGQEWANQMNAYVDENFKFCEVFFKEHLPKVKFRIPEGTYLAWPNVSEYGYPTSRLEHILVKEAKLLLEAGDMFGETGAGYLRLNVACPRVILEQSLYKLERILNRVREGEPIRESAEINCDGQRKILWFLRNEGCAFTQAKLKEISSQYDALRSMGIECCAVVDHAAAETIAACEFPVYQDEDGSLRQLYRVYPAPSSKMLYNHDAAESLLQLRAMNIVNGKMKGDPALLPAVFLFDGQGICTFAHYAANVGDLPEVSALLKKFL